MNEEKQWLKCDIYWDGKWWEHLLFRSWSSDWALRPLRARQTQLIRPYQPRHRGDTAQCVRDTVLVPRRGWQVSRNISDRMTAPGWHRGIRCKNYGGKIALSRKSWKYVILYLSSDRKLNCQILVLCWPPSLVALTDVMRLARIWAIDVVSEGNDWLLHQFSV